LATIDSFALSFPDGTTTAQEAVELAEGDPIAHDNVTIDRPRTVSSSAHEPA